MFGKKLVQQMKKRITAVMLVLTMVVVPVTEADAAETVDVKKIEGDYDDAWGTGEELFSVKKDGKYGLVDKTGKEVAPCQYDELLSFSEGMVPVKKNEKYGFADKTGKEVVPCQYDQAYDFSEGLALVQKDGKRGYIDQSGNEVIPCQYDDGWVFSEGLADIGKGTYPNTKYGYINQRGEEVIPCQYDEAWDYSEGLAVIGKGTWPNTKYGYINQRGEEVIPCQYDQVYDFSEGLAGVKKDGKWGFVDKTGNEVIPCQYDEARDYSEGLAGVKKDGKWGFVDKTGNEVIPCQYDAGWDYSEGLAAVKRDGKWGFVDKTGNEVIPCQYDDTWSFFDRLTWVKKNGKEGYIDMAGKEVIPCQYDRGTIFFEGSALAKKGNQWYLLTLNANDNTDSLQAPKVKTNLVNITQTKLTWNKVSHASGYDIYRATSKNGTYKKLASVSSAKTSYVDTACKQGYTYYYKVIAYNASGTQTTSDIQSKKIPVVQTDYSIAAPTISSVEKSGKNIVIRWEKITKGNGYVIYRSTDNKNFNVYKVIKGLGTTNLTDKNVKSGNNYYYRISTYYGNAAKQSPISPTYVIKTKELKNDSFKTKLLSVTKKENKKQTVTLRWKKLSNASGYIIYRKEGNGKYKSLYTINNASKESIDDVNLSVGKTYTYYIKPFKLVDSNGVKIKYLGSASNKISIKE